MPKTIKAVAGRHVRFLGIVRRVEVGEKFPHRAVTFTFKSALHAAIMGSGSIIGRCPKSTNLMHCLSPCDTSADVWRGTAGIWAASDRFMDGLGCPIFGPMPARCVRCPIEHQTGTCIFILRADCDEKKVTRCPPNSQK